MPAGMSVHGTTVVTMTRKETCEVHLSTLLMERPNSRRGTTVPTMETVGGGVFLDAVYLYADMADLSGMARRFTFEAGAKIVRAHLATVSRVLRHHDGYIRSFDGDRVMAIFVGKEAASRAARAALEIKWAVANIVHEKLQLRVDEYYESSWKISHRTGIDMGTAFIVRGGVRNNSDLGSVGNALNVAAKLSDMRGARIWMSDRL
jgi:adenylate cyclase